MKKIVVVGTRMILTLGKNYRWEQVDVTFSTRWLRLGKPVPTSPLSICFGLFIWLLKFKLKLQVHREVTLTLSSVSTCVSVRLQCMDKTAHSSIRKPSQELRVVFSAVYASAGFGVGAASGLRSGCGTAEQTSDMQSHFIVPRSSL